MISQTIIFCFILAVTAAGVKRIDNVLENWDDLSGNERRNDFFENSVSVSEKELEEDPVKNKFRCPFLNPWLDAVAHPASDPECGHGEPGWQARPTCRCQYIAKDRDENGCTLKFFTLCTSSIFDVSFQMSSRRDACECQTIASFHLFVQLEDSSGENPVFEWTSKSKSIDREDTQVLDKNIDDSQLESVDTSKPLEEFGILKL